MRIDDNNPAFSIRELQSAIHHRVVAEMKAEKQDTTVTYSRIVERYALFFDRPEVRLRFLNKTLARQTEREKQLHESLRRFAFFRNTRLYQWLLELGLYRLIFEEIQGFLPTVPAERRPSLKDIKAPVSATLFYHLYKVRYLFYAAGMGVAAAGLFGLYLVGAWSVRNVNDYIVRRYRTQNPAVQTSGTGTALAAGVQYLPDYKAEKVWPVKQEANYELYSNGARILTDYEVENHPRQYYRFKRGAEVPDGTTIYSDPVGIVYHTSENEMVDFRPDNNDSIQKRTIGLLNYIRERRLYNYLIDRFGQIYRIVRDDQAAHHAGYSAWADAQHLYVGLNESFLGVCFESSMKQAGTDDQLTEAQISSGRALTAVLRSLYSIDEANCVTHGLVSLNPDAMQIAPHYDGARGFVFEAMGVSDKYQVPPVTINEYGFTWDDELLTKLGGSLWPGVAKAKDEFAQRAAAIGVDVETLRKQMRDTYRKQYELGKRLREGSATQTE